MTGMPGSQVSSAMTDSKHLAFKMELAGGEREEMREEGCLKKYNLWVPVCAQGGNTHQILWN